MRDDGITVVLVALFISVSFVGVAQVVSAQDEEPSTRTSSMPVRPTEKFLLKEGTEVNLKLAQKLSAKSAVVGEPVELVLAQDLKVNDVTVVRQGARVLGTVVAGKQSEKKRNESHQLAMR